jgi:triacylglycerol esterase/lipase EstA (alpha/beta hydrolase family)
MEGQWLRQPSKGIVAVYVHGILSSGESCWRTKNGPYWPELFLSDTSLSDVGVYVLTYKTGVFSGTYDLGDVVDALKPHLHLDNVWGQHQLIFICHSMGGIVVRRYLIQQQVSIVEQQKQMGLFLIASPSPGAKYADWLSPLALFFKHAQAEALRFVENNAWLKDLDKEFLNMKEARRFTLIGKELIEDNFIIFRRFIKTPSSPDDQRSQVFWRTV